MPAEAKPLFRPDALRPKLRGFSLPGTVSETRKKLAHWAELVHSERAAGMKETELLPDFIHDVFGDLLAFAGPASGLPVYTLKREALVQVDGKFADAGLGRFSAAGDRAEFIAVLEGKGPRDPLDRPFAGRKRSAVEQALQYAVNLQIDWYLVTNLKETRLYHKGHDQFTFERFDTAALAGDDSALRKFVYLLGAERLVPATGRGHLDGLLADSQRVGLELTRDYYREYAALRRQTFEQMKAHNPAVPTAALLSATQKILDRILFIAFCEDRGLLPAESIAHAYRHADLYNPRPIWENFKGLFRAVNEGSKPLSIECYNGGLFAPDEFLEKLKVPDEVCRGLDKLAAYDYRSPTAADDEAPAGAARLVDVEVLGHIFEQSISDLEELHQRIAGKEQVGTNVGGTGVSPVQTSDRRDAGPTATGPIETRSKGPSKRKKEGAFYTPSFVTRFIVAQTLRPVLDERFEALRQKHEKQAAAAIRKVLLDPSAYDVPKLSKAAIAVLVKFWEAWQDELGTVRIVDPACGSGAFLIEAFEQLYDHYRLAVGRLKELRGETFFDIDKHILQQNLFGVDLNEEAVEICRLSLWIKTAQLGKVLTSLDANIRVGNSIVADPAVHPRALDWQAAFPDVFAAGGFDVVIGNPPYVRQEWISPYKPYLQQHYRAYDGVADLYVYFYELGLNVLRPGGRLGFVVTNKWMKAGYGEALRRLFGEAAWVESVVDFGHAKQIFPDADVFPSILTIRKPAKGPPPEEARVCAIPREQLRIDDLSRQIAAEGIPVPRNRFGADPWNLEPPGVATLMEKLKKKGIPLKEFGGGSRTFRGPTTGFNEAFVVDTSTRNRLIAEHPTSAGILLKYLRGQDVDRWYSPWAGEWMIFARRGIDIDQCPAIKRHLEKFRTQLEPKPKGWAGADWRGRKPGAYKWYELQDSADFWREFEKPKVAYQEIQFHPCFALDTEGMLANNKVSFITTDDLYVLGVLNSPAMWWHNWRFLPHMKDEALAPVGYMVQEFPVPVPTNECRAAVETAVSRLISRTVEQYAGRIAFLDWLRVEYAIEKPSQKLQDVPALDADGLVAEVRKIRGKKQPLSVTGLKALKEEHGRTVAPLQALAAEAQGLERQVSELVNQAYGLTPEEVELMWKTAPPRMPIGPAK